MMSRLTAPEYCPTLRGDRSSEVIVSALGKSCLTESTSPIQPNDFNSLAASVRAGGGLYHNGWRMGSNLRRRGGVWWFRRRVPDGLHARLGLAEISRSLRTRSFMTARARAKRLSLSTESLFAVMSSNPSLTEKGAKLILDQLAGEPLFASPTADDLVASVVQGDGSLASLLFHGTAPGRCAKPSRRRGSGRRNLG